MYAESGKTSEAEAVYAELKSRSMHEYVQPGILAGTAAALGKNEEALQFAEQACDERDTILPIIVSRPFAAGLRHIPGFDKIRERMGY